MPTRIEFAGPRHARVRRPDQSPFLDGQSGFHPGGHSRHNRVSGFYHPCGLCAEAAASLSDLFDRMQSAVFLISADGRLTHRNKAAAELLAQDDVLACRGDRLVLRNQAANASLAALLASSQRGNHEISREGVAVPFTASNGEHYVAQALPLSAGLRQSVGKPDAVALLVRKAGIAWASLVEPVAKAYKLTPAEVRVLLAVAEHDGGPQAAAALGISEETFRTHLKRVFDKTGKRRQIDLLKLLAEFAVSL